MSMESKHDHTTSSKAPAAEAVVVEMANVVKVLESEDDRILREMGYKQELRRGFNGLMSFAFCYTTVAVLSSISLEYGYGLQTGGPAVMAWGWIINSVMTLCVGCCLAEICSTYPSAGSVYHWAGQLSSAENAPLLSYICGWFNFLGKQNWLAEYSVVKEG